MTAVAEDAAIARCAGKQGFDTFKGAERARPKRAGDVLIYRCRNCNLWHVGGSSGKKLKDRRR